MEQLLGQTISDPLSLTSLAINMLLSIVLTSIIAWFYRIYGRSFSNRAKLASILPILAMITVLIISVVKSSLALSLGLVGALSIVRFRTAIKEPEELIYLFMAIAIGVGLGADQRWPTVLAVAIMLGYLILHQLQSEKPPKNNLFLNVATTNHDHVFGQINDLLLEYAERADLRRLDRNDGGLQATYLIRTKDDQTLTHLMDSLRTELPGCELSFVEQDTTLGG